MRDSSRRIPATRDPPCMPSIPLLGEDRKRAQDELAGIAGRSETVGLPIKSGTVRLSEARESSCRFIGGLRLGATLGRMLTREATHDGPHAVVSQTRFNSE